MVTDIAAALIWDQFFERSLRLLQIKAKLWICNCQSVIRKNCRISGNHKIMAQRPYRYMPWRISGSIENLTASAPIKSISGAEDTAQ